MTNKISFKNYKIFKNLESLEIKPITIIFGKNNSGKSAILKLPTLIENALKNTSKEVFDIADSNFGINGELRDLVYGRGTKVVEFTLENSLTRSQLQVEFYVDSTSKDQQSKIEHWQLDLADSSKIDIQLDENNIYLEHSNTVQNIIFNGINLSGLGIPTYLDKKMEDFCFNVDYIGPIRMIPARDIRINKSQHSRSGIFGENTYTTLIQSSLSSEKEVLSKVSRWYESNFEGWSIEIDKAREPIYHINIVNQEIKTNILDAGLGITQALPIVIRAMTKCTENTLIVIEEPETHLHPVAHGNLAELISDSIKEDSLKSYLIETHSLNFILRLRRLVAEKKIDKEMINMYYVDFEKEKSTSVLKKILVNEDGSVDSWPEKVFSEALDESIAIRNAQLKNLR